MSATKHLLKALDACWIYEDAKLMQLIADAIDRAEELDAKAAAEAKINDKSSG